MTEQISKRPDEAIALFVSDDELRLRINPEDRPRSLPRDDQAARGERPPPQARCFRWKVLAEVRAGLDQDNGLPGPVIAMHAEVEDGVENFDAAPSRKRRRR